jgi:hypothetical protein
MQKKFFKKLFKLILKLIILYLFFLVFSGYIYYSDPLYYGLHYYNDKKINSLMYDSLYGKKITPAKNIFKTIDYPDNSYFFILGPYDSLNYGLKSSDFYIDCGFIDKFKQNKYSYSFSNSKDGHSDIYIVNDRSDFIKKISVSRYLFCNITPIKCFNIDKSYVKPIPQKEGNKLCFQIF